MSNISEIINACTGLNFEIADSVILRHGRRAERAYIKLGDFKIAFMFIDLRASSIKAQEMQDLYDLSEYERIIIYSSHLLNAQMKELRNKKIGYIDEHENFYIPLDVVSSNIKFSNENTAPTRSSSTLNEFPIGYLFLKNYGLLALTQADIGKQLDKSPATVNLVLKRMEREKLIVKTDRGYHLTNLENYFDRWRFVLSQYKARKEYARYVTKLNDSELKKLLFEKIQEEKWALSGPKVESLLGDGYLEAALDLSIFVDTKSQNAMMKKLKLIPDPKGEITVYPTTLDFRDKGQLAHDIVSCAELINSNNPRVKEAGVRRFEFYIQEAKKVMNERFGNRSF